MDTTTTAAVRARELRKDFGEGPTRIEVLRGVDFEALLGQLTFLVGPSGCGKTTLISVIAGLLDSSGGEVRLFDQNIERFSATERILTSGERTPSGLVWQLADHVGLVRACRDFARDGVSVSEAAKRLRKKEYPVRKAFGQAEAFSDAELDDAVTRLAALDHAVKGGSRLPDDLELERTLVAITR